MNEFSRCHPSVNFVYFSGVIVFSCIFMHPVCLAISLIGSAAYLLILSRKDFIRTNVTVILPFVLFASAINILFNHKGATILAYFPSGNPLTLESLVYSLAASAMLASMLMWFSCFNKIMTSDKFIYLFGKLSPALSLALSMTLRFIPRFSRGIKEISAAQSLLGKGTGNGGIIRRLKNGINILSAMITVSLENSAQTAVSMKSRGFGQKKRTSFHLYKFDMRDIILLSLFLFMSVYIIAGAGLGKLGFSYFPITDKKPCDIYSLSVFAAYFILCVTPAVFEITEDLKWRFLK
ncbi:MAG: energy-coupling factor transporter transmembrane protein EcfT [Oscillospiraceae bacterium]|nr:energy-coupling factor transporter transmembrane protein EcfT [Oscillospiraceae bacterium]